MFHKLKKVYIERFAAGYGYPESFMVGYFPGLVSTVSLLKILSGKDWA